MNERIMELTTTTPAALTSRADVTPVIELFAASQDRKPTTRDLYARTVAAFFAWVAETGRTVSNLTAVDVIAYKEQLSKDGKTALTVASYVNSIRRFYTWAEANKIYPNIAADVHAPKRRQEFKKQALSARKVGELLNYEASTNRRDYAIVNLMARTGLRCIEVVRANIGDITYMGENNTRVLMVQGKGADEKDNFVVLTDAAYKPIRDYLNAERKGEPDTAPLFVSTSNHTATAEAHTHDTDYNPRRLSTRTVSSIAKNGLRAVGLDNKAFTAHSLRHTVGTNILRAGGTLEQAQMTLRHASPATTEIYARMALKERRFTDGGESLLDRFYNA